MNKKIWAQFLFCAFFVWSNVSAEGKYPTTFSYTGQVSQVGSVTWEPGGQILNEGFHISFFGSPRIYGSTNANDCAATTTIQNGAVTTNLFWANLQEDTGLEAGEWTQQWSPLSDSHCISKGRQGYSHAHIKNVAGGGVGLYTHTGANQPNSALSFFQPYSAAGDRSGANANIQAVTAGFRNTPYMSNARLTKPFSSVYAQGNNDRLRTAIRTTQGLAKFEMEESGTQQIRQQTVVTFLHKGCILRQPQPPAGACHMHMLFLSAMAGIYSSVPYAVMFADPAQGSIPAIYGPLGEAGVTTSARDGLGNLFPVWTSWGAATQTSAWSGKKTFQPEISYNQLMNLLKLATAKKVGLSNANAVTADQLNTWFGPNYGDPNQWILLDVSLSQEVYNPSVPKRAFVGGNASEFSVFALPWADGW